MSDYGTPSLAGKQPQVQQQTELLSLETNKLYELANQLVTRLNNAGILAPIPNAAKTPDVPPNNLVPLAKSLSDSVNTMRSASRLIDDILGNLEV